VRPAAARITLIRAVVFDMDGVLVQSEEMWDEARRELVESSGGRWHEGAQREMMGMSSVEWSRYMHESLGVETEPEEISAEVVRRMSAIYRERLPLIDGAPEAVERLAAEWPLAVASSANRELIDLALSLSGLDRYFGASVSSEEVARGKPAPDVYLEAARRLGVDPASCAAVEDSTNGLLSAKAAGMLVVAAPNPAYPPEQRGLDAAGIVLDGIDELTAERLRDGA
jgi:HAD superfamily hydrolase (TIGR01509 family)